MGALFFVFAYLIGVGWQGNGTKLTSEFGADFKGFAPFLGSVIFLMFLSNTKAKPLVSPFITLAVITTVLRNFDTVKTEVATTYKTIST